MDHSLLIGALALMTLVAVVSNLVIERIGLVKAKTNIIIRQSRTVRRIRRTGEGIRAIPTGRLSSAADQIR